MTDFVWKITNLERSNDSDGVVQVVHYRVDAIDGEHSAGAYGSLNFEGDAADSAFIQFDDLTEDDVIGWVKDHFGKTKVDEIQATLLAQLALEKNPPLVSGLPWE